jgi:hypothetical protein
LAGLDQLGELLLGDPLERARLFELLDQQGKEKVSSLISRYQRPRSSRRRL